MASNDYSPNGKKIKRIMFEGQAQNCAPQCSCEKLEDIVKEQSKLIQHQTEVLAKHLGEQKTMLSRLLSDRLSGRSLYKHFPFETEEQLELIDNHIKNGDKEAYVLKTLLLPKGVLKNFRYIISDEIADSYNVEV